jgi:hypothetical protein
MEPWPEISRRLGEKGRFERISSVSKACEDDTENMKQGETARDAGGETVMTFGAPFFAILASSSPSMVSDRRLLRKESDLRPGTSCPYKPPTF